MNGNMWDEIRIEKLEIYAHHGVFQEEKQDGQLFYVNAVLYTDLHPAGINDDLTLSTHYGEVSLFIKKWMTEHTYDLIETAAETTAQEILLQFPRIMAISLEVRKPHAPIPMKFDSVSVKIYRKWHEAYIALGSNMGNSEELIANAIKKLSEDQFNQMGKISDTIVTKPYGGVKQDDFYNGVLQMRTLYTPGELLDILHELEKDAGRERKIHWGPRTLDLDIIFYDHEIYEDKNLIIPHVDMQNRDFVLKPMTQIAPWFRHPVLQKTMLELNQLLDGRKEGKKADEENFS
ncbi:MAG TPA: 2-amino-4-hydroxy-6-hydroxymethyldihydropteridine diphosphokinase [Lachnospiraceae bacterium]|nr:2-amino-4-hydroxy-6-hydroxymethyldihydropteridine diphosphokinase [Lachnospiraceae bacterium]